MRGWFWLSIAALAALGACQKKSAGEGAREATVLAPQAPPPRAAGLWEQRVTSGDFSQTSRICLDAATDKRLAWWGAEAGKGICQENRVTPRPEGGWQFVSVCDTGAGGKVATTGVAVGDLSRNYQVRAETATTGARAPQMNGSRKLTVEAVWRGPCPADMKPGDMSLPGGIKVNLLEMVGG